MSSPIPATEYTLTEEIKALKGLQPFTKKSIGVVVKRIAEHEGRIVISGMGKSGHIGQTIAATFSSLGIPTLFVHPTEALHGDLGVIAPFDILLAISTSGESKELMKVVRFAKRKKNLIISITGAAESTLSTYADLPIIFSITNEGSPHGLAPMASSTTTLVIGHMIASGVAASRNFKPLDFAALHPGGSLGLKLQLVKQSMRPLKEFPIVTTTTVMQEVLTKMSTKKTAGIAAVVDQKKQLIGVITDGDIRRVLTHHPFHLTTTAREIMTAHPKAVRMNTTLYEAVRVLEKNKITSLFVTNDTGKLCGLLHIHDIVERELI